MTTENFNVYMGHGRHGKTIELWNPIPRDKDGFVEWDLLGLPRQGAYICALDCGGYETTFELLTESDMKHVVAVLPFVEFEK